VAIEGVISCDGCCTVLMCRDVKLLAVTGVDEGCFWEMRIGISREK